MKKIIFFGIVISIIHIFSFGSISGQAYKIKVTLHGISGDSLFLGHYYGEKLYASDTCILNGKGFGVFSKKKKLEGGLYAVIVPSRKSSFFELIITENNQSFSVESDTSYVKSMKVKGSKENEIFYDFQKRMTSLKSVAVNLQKRYTANKDNKDSVKFLTNKLDSLNLVKDSFWEKEIHDYPNTFFSKIVLAMTPVKIPEPDVDKNVKGHDSIVAFIKYNYNVRHYFDNIDFGDPRLIRTPFVEQLFKEYVKNNLVPNFDSIAAAVNELIEKSKENNEFFRYILSTALNYFWSSQVIGMDAVVVSIAERYYLSGQATWADTSLLKKINKFVVQNKPNLLGKVAHDLKLESVNGEVISLHQVKAKFTVLVFWSPDCGHCKKEIPLMHDKYQGWKDKGVEVYAVLDGPKEKEWREFIEKNNLDDWINVFDKYWRSNFKAYFIADTTPFIYLLDENKVILAKKIGLEDLDKFIDRLSKKDEPLNH